MPEKLPVDAKAQLISKMLDDFDFYSEHGVCPAEQSFTIIASDEHTLVETGARYSALKEMNKGIEKVAFDTRRINQETDYIPRINLQNWHRSDKFIDDETQGKVSVLDKLYNVVKELKAELHTQPEWLESYARTLSNHMDRLHIHHEGDNFTEVFKPHVIYLEQLLYNRYRLSLNDIRHATHDMLRDRILSKDASLNRCREHLKASALKQEPEIKKTTETNMATNNDAVLNLLTSIVKNNETQIQNIATNDKIIALLSQAVNKPEQPKDPLTALFGGGALRTNGEKSVERTITIKIVDTVKDEV